MCRLLGWGRSLIHRGQLEAGHVFAACYLSNNQSNCCRTLPAVEAGSSPAPSHGIGFFLIAKLSVGSCNLMLITTTRSALIGP